MPDNLPNQDETQKEIKILSCSAEFYIATQGRSISAYRTVALDEIVLNDPDSTYNIKNAARRLGCEVVTDIRQIGHPSQARQRFIGIGLILRKESDNPKEKLENEL